MDIGIITNAVIGLLGKYGADLATKAGGAVAKIAREIYNVVKQNLGKNNEAKQTFDLYEKDPETFESALRTILQRHFEQNQAFAQQIQGLFDNLERVAPPETVSKIILKGSGAIATNDGVAAGKGGYAAGGDIHIGTKPDKKG